MHRLQATQKLHIIYKSDGSSSRLSSAVGVAVADAFFLLILLTTEVRARQLCMNEWWSCDRSCDSMWCNTLGMWQLTSTCVTSQLAAHVHMSCDIHMTGQIMWQVMWPAYFSKWIFLVAAPSTSGPQWRWWLPLGSAEFPPPPDRPPPSGC